MGTVKYLTPEEVEAYAKSLRPSEEWMAWAITQAPSNRSQADRIEQKVDALTALVQHLVDSLAGDDGDEPPAKTLDGEPDGGERDQSQAL